MLVATPLRHGPITVFDCRCTAGPGDRPFVERHKQHTVSFVRRGAFGYQHRGRSFELVTGSILVGRPGDEFMCTHDHVHGDECLSFRLEAGLAESLGEAATWRVGSVPPLSELMVLGERGSGPAARAACSDARVWMKPPCQFARTIPSTSRSTASTLRRGHVQSIAVVPSRRHCGSMTTLRSRSISKERRRKRA